MKNTIGVCIVLKVANTCVDMERGALDTNRGCFTRVKAFKQPHGGVTIRSMPVKLRFSIVVFLEFWEHYRSFLAAGRCARFLQMIVTRPDLQLEPC